MRRILLFGFLVIVSLVLVGCVQPGTSVPVGRAAATAVIATACNGDSLCETTKVRSQLITTDILNTRDASVSRDLTVARNVVINGNAKISGIGGIVIDDLSGAGNAYACLNSRGKLFRSTTPCQ